MLTTLKDADVRVGIKQSKKEVEAGNVQTAFVAEDADPHVTEPFVRLCAQKAVEVVYVGSMAELGHAAGIHVGAAVAVKLKSV